MEAAATASSDERWDDEAFETCTPLKPALQQPYACGPYVHNKIDHRLAMMNEQSTDDGSGTQLVSKSDRAWRAQSACAHNFSITAPISINNQVIKTW